ncbi:secretory protein [Aureibaculum algae]|uniref:Secretory protein n=1 Tax=Aureibaculum algae TaxID=2584122 RepID=A0A5B7TL85_9FLAO|nr:basic secretory protein-like protein [Aureibaculum algae]QCX37409.1 secretory protein [Aureibaculum algae]
MINIQFVNITLKINKVKLFFLLILTFACVTLQGCAEKDSKSSQQAPEITVINEDANLPPTIIEEFQNIIYKVYPQLVEDFNNNARMNITIKIDTTYNGVAYASNGRVTVSSQWLDAKPNDLDLMTHEIMHIIQAYPNNSGPGWLIEGIADYVRHKYGVSNAKAGWSLTEFSDTQSYENSYRITARFLVWLSENYDEKIVNKLDDELRSGDYSSDLWKEYTGFNIDQLWDLYSKNPEIKS